MTKRRELLLTAAEVAADYREGPPARIQVVQALVDAARPGLVATAGPRYFGFVVGGSLDAATAAEVLAAG